MDRSDLRTPWIRRLEDIHLADYRIYGEGGGGQHHECSVRHQHVQSSGNPWKFLHTAVCSQFFGVYLIIYSMCGGSGSYQAGDGFFLAGGGHCSDAVRDRLADGVFGIPGGKPFLNKQKGKRWEF